MTTILAPTGNSEALRQFHNLMLQKGYEISKGLGEIANKIWRISLFGDVANKGEIDQLVDVIKECMAETCTNGH
jgi:aspartate aminotransferase-like enzyme